MLSILEIITSSFKMALLELWKNKLRTFLSLFGVTIGIFCIIGVLAMVKSLEKNIQKSIETLGTNTIYVDKWDWGSSGTPDYPYWKFAKRPTPSYEELEEIKRRTNAVQYGAFLIYSVSNAEYGDLRLDNVIFYGITAEYPRIQPLEIAFGRPISDHEFERGSNICMIGDEVAEQLFGTPERATGKQVTIRGRKLLVVGVIKKEGKQGIGGGWQFDKSIVTPYKYARTVMDEKRSNPMLMVKGHEQISTAVLKDELTGVMRSVRKLSPGEESNFALNGVDDISQRMKPAITSINIGGWAIGALAFIVGIFGVANIMFVTVRERTPQIGLKKAIGAPGHIILMEFLLESAFLCIVGGVIGLLFVLVLSMIITALGFPVFLTPDIVALALLICIIAGVAAGIIPAIKAARMDPVVAIRSK